MNKLVFVVAIITLTSAAELPSARYLPPNGPGSASNQFGPSGSGGFNGPNGPNGPGAVNNRPQQAAEKNAAILRQDQEIGENGFQYSYETSNGIQAEESGNAAQTRGGFAYKGDDGQVYSVTFTAGEDGFRPQGAHLPIPPPTPEAILEALKQNERDEAAGIFDDGQYHPENNNKGGPGQSFGSANHQGSFNSNSGYTY